jgi:LmbE family N-acetylglucosaminyl deacetylase
VRPVSGLSGPPAGDLGAVRALFVSPHLDDVALSCGGLVCRSAALAERPRIVTLFTLGPAPEDELTPLAHRLHEAWSAGAERSADELWQARRDEDAAAAAELGAERAWLPFQDALYRGGQYASERELFGVIKAADLPLIERLAEDLTALWRGTARAVVYLPLAVGRHVDHQIAYALAEPLRRAGAPVLHYEDYPYSARPGDLEQRIAELPPLAPRTIDVSPHLPRRLRAIAAYASQLPFIFADVGPWEETTRRFAAARAEGGAIYAERVWEDPGASRAGPAVL